VACENGETYLPSSYMKDLTKVYIRNLTCPNYILQVYHLDLYEPQMVYYDRKFRFSTEQLSVITPPESGLPQDIGTYERNDVQTEKIS
jgi:hypothetical protein